MAKHLRDRCDHCGRWTDAGGNFLDKTTGQMDGLYNLSGSLGDDGYKYAVCGKCCDNHKTSYWIRWAEKRKDSSNDRHQ